MSVIEIESAIKQLPPAELAKLARWFEEFHSHEWDMQIEQNINAGKLDKLANQAKAEYDAGQCKPL